MCVIELFAAEQKETLSAASAIIKAHMRRSLALSADDRARKEKRKKNNRDKGRTFRDVGLQASV